ncbi:zinc finger protein 414 [Mobula hypostoma]|uniref:zinc finger protein 414 n=1 Tax=Mobula hypostoma TaxID=723540 RepID=UPI002FC2830F
MGITMVSKTSPPAVVIEQSHRKDTIGAGLWVSCCNRVIGTFPCQQSARGVTRDACAPAAGVPGTATPRSLAQPRDTCALKWLQCSRVSVANVIRCPRRPRARPPVGGSVRPDRDRGWCRGPSPSPCPARRGDRAARQLRVVRRQKHRDKWFCLESGVSSSSFKPASYDEPSPRAGRIMSHSTEPEKRMVAATQSLEGKVYNCCTRDCKQSFSTMHLLMNHMRVHHKPNRYFKCLTCKGRFHKPQSFYKHQHVCCSEVNNVVQKRCPSPLSASEPDVRVKQAAPVEPVKFQSVIKQLEKDGNEDIVSTAPSSKPVTLLPSGLPSLHTSLNTMPLVSATPHAFSLLEPSLFATPSLRFPSQGHTPVPGPFIPYIHPTPFGLPQSATQPRLGSYVPSESLPFSNAVWRKTTAQSANSRIEWEHTRGRYNCMQCPYSSEAREEMILHIQEHNKVLSSRLVNEKGMFINPGDNYSALSMQFSESLLT